MRRFAAVMVLLAGVVAASAEDPKGTVVEVGGMKATTPADWKAPEKIGTMRINQFVVPKAEKDTEDADVSVFFFKGGSGTVEQNLERQRKKFTPADGKDKIGEKLDKKFKVGTIESTYQDITGTFLKKPFPMAEKGTPTPGYRQLYVVFETKDGQYYVWLLGPEKTVEKHKKGFDEWLTSFK